MKKLIWSLSFIFLLSVIVYTQSRGTPSQLRVKIDSTGALAVSSAAITNPVTIQTFSNARLKVDASGNLVITDGSGSGFAPADATYIVKTVSSGLSNEQSLGALTTAALINTVSGSTGTLSAYAGVTCTNSVLTALSAILGGTCSSTIQLVQLTLTGDSFTAGESYSTTTADNCLVASIGPTIVGGFRHFASHNFGLNTLGCGNLLSAPALTYTAISGDGTSATMTGPIYRYNAQTVTMAGGVQGFNGQGWEWQNNGTAFLRWCFTDLTTNCTSVPTGGTKVAFYDYSLNANSIIKFNIARFVTSILADTDNAVDIGANGANRPRTVYAGTSIVVPVGTFATSISAPILNADTTATKLYGAEISDPTAPATNGGVIYFKDNGAGKTQACARFNSGAVQCFATEP